MWCHQMGWQGCPGKVGKVGKVGSMGIAEFVERDGASL